MLVLLGLLLMASGVVPRTSSMIQDSDRNHGKSSALMSDSVPRQQLVNHKQQHYLQQDLDSVQKMHSKLDEVHKFSNYVHHLRVRSAHNNVSSYWHGVEDRDNCTNPRNPPQHYKTSCDYVRDECASKAELIDYMSFVVCHLPSLQVSFHSLKLFCH